MTVKDAGASMSSARGRVREDVRRLILSGELSPGMRLTQQQLAKRFGVAQSVVRESLLELQFSGLVQMVDNLGIFVSELDTNTLLQAYQVREMLEGMAARICCDTASRADIKTLSDLAERIHQTGVAGQDVERGKLDREFHHKTIVLSQNKILERLTQAYHVLGTTVLVSRTHDIIRNEHMGIVEAISNNDPEEAEQRARAHVAGARRAIQKQIAEGNFQPQWVVD
jgi:DNA-binding GntR family transcriptional regulator